MCVIVKVIVACRLSPIFLGIYDSCCLAEICVPWGRPIETQLGLTPNFCVLLSGKQFFAPKVQQETCPALYALLVSEGCFLERARPGDDFLKEMWGFWPMVACRGPVPWDLRDLLAFGCVRFRSPQSFVLKGRAFESRNALEFPSRPGPP